MKATELIKRLQAEVASFGDQEITVYCPIHSGEDGDPVAVHGLGWFCGSKGEKSCFIECAECHADARNDKLWSDYMEELGL